MRKVILKRRSSLSAERMESRLLLRRAALPFTSFVGMKTVGPQLVACCYLPPAEKYPGHPEYRPAPPARLQIQVTLGPPWASIRCVSLWGLLKTKCDEAGHGQGDVPGHRQPLCNVTGLSTKYCWCSYKHLSKRLGHDRCVAVWV